jgi:hypothetical protein
MAISIIDVAKYGELGYGNDTAIFQVALDSVEGYGGTVIYPAPIYVPTEPLVVSKNGTHVIGAGPYATSVCPAVGFSGKVFDFTAGASELYQCSLKGWGFIGAGTNQKTAISVVDASQCLIENIKISNWTGSDSIGLQLKGRDNFSIRKISIDADIPVSIEPCPHYWNSFDMSHLQDIYLVTRKPEGAAITIAPGCSLNQVKIDGYVSLCKGKYGIYWSDPNPPNPNDGTMSGNLNFKDCRVEQFDDLTGHSIYIDGPVIHVLTIENWALEPNSAGLYFRHVHGLNVSKSHYLGDQNVVDVDTSCSSVRVVDNQFNPYCLYSWGGLQMTSAIDGMRSQ